MTGKPSRSTLDVVDDAWDALENEGAKPPKRRARSPTRAGTNPWDDRTLPLLARGEARLAKRASAVRSGTLSLDELLPPPVRHLRDEEAEARARAARPVRGGTRSWDEILAELRAERSAAAEAGSTADPFDDLPADLIDWLSSSGPRS
jgi:hypothetical protein